MIVRHLAFCIFILCKFTSLLHVSTDEYSNGLGDDAPTLRILYPFFAGDFVEGDLTGIKRNRGRCDEGAILFWLSALTTIGPCNETPRLLRKSTIHTDSLDAWQSAIYSASVDESATQDCFFDFQLTAPSPILIIYAPIERRSSR